MVVGFCGTLLFLFVPESFWDRTPIPRVRKQSRNGSRFSIFSRRNSHAVPKDVSPNLGDGNEKHTDLEKPATDDAANGTLSPDRPLNVRKSTTRTLHVGFVSAEHQEETKRGNAGEDGAGDDHSLASTGATCALGRTTSKICTPTMPELHDVDSRSDRDIEKIAPDDTTAERPKTDGGSAHSLAHSPPANLYTHGLKNRPQLTFLQTLKPFNGRLHDDKWFRVALRPFILYAYPAVLWSALVYSCSIGWLIVLSESVAVIYRSRDTYNFSALSTGLIYLSPFIGGILGTAVAGKVSDIIVKAMSKRNGGLYEPEFRLVMAIPITISTVIGLMGFGWSAQEHDAWIVPTIFFGIISFGCSLGSTTAITFCVDSYRQYAGEALVTLNFSKNIFHGLVFSLFFTNWLERDGSKMVFIWVGVIQLIMMCVSVPMYIYGKRARMWTVRKNLMEKF